MSPAVVQNLLFFGLLALGFYLLAIRPQRARAAALAKVRASLAPGTEVITTAGLYAYVVEIDGDTVVLEIAPGVKARFATAAVVRVVEPKDADDPAAGGSSAGSAAPPPDAPPAPGGAA